MPQDNRHLLVDAIARNCGLVLSLPSAGLFRHHKSRFLGDAEGGFWVESAPNERPLIDELITSRQPAGISFRSGPLKVVFASALTQVELDFRLSDGIAVQALLIAMPQEIKTIQRRSNYRVAVLEDSGLSVRIWRVAERAYLGDRPMASQELNTRLCDISTGGLGVLFLPKNEEAPKVGTEDRLRIELKYADLSFLVEGRCRSGHPTSGGVRTGIAFKSLERDLEGRQKLAHLTRIVGEMQRAEVRRNRLGMTQPAAAATPAA